MEEEEEEEEENQTDDSSCENEKEAGTSDKNVLVTKPEEQTNVSNTGFNLNLNSDPKQPPSSRLVLPPLTQPAAAPECLKMRRCKTPLPPINLSEQTSTMSANFTIGSCKGDGFVKGVESDSRPWINNPLLSKSRSAEFCLPDISLSTLDTLLQTVSQKLGRKKRGGDEEPWRRIQSDHLLMAVTDQRLRKTRVEQGIDRCTKNSCPTNIETEKEALVGECRDRQRRLPPLHSPPRPTLILTLTKKDLSTPSILQ
ncbi:uncharacterized protein LOC117828262 isoform X2 [Xyrichtys novacula]|nr:uncharacterized protein LOC117828262 isoform X2 [Xyrichtys novacula]